MMQLLVGKQIFIVEDEFVFCLFLDLWFFFLGVIMVLVGDGVDVLELMGCFIFDFMICDIVMLRMNGFKLVENLCNCGDQMFILVIFVIENMVDIVKVLCFGVEDVLLKLVKDFNCLWEIVFVCLYFNMFNLWVEEEECLFCDWDVMVSNLIVVV